MAIDVDTVATDADLDDLLGGQLLAHVRMLPQSWGDAKRARQHALDVTLEALVRRTPPIRTTDISDVSELKRAVLYGAAAKLYEVGLTTANEGEVFHSKWQHYEMMFRREIDNVVITSPYNERIVSRSPSISRR